MYGRCKIINRQAMCRELWGLRLEDGWVWELDSSSPAKWSRHIIVVVPGRAFPSNLALGAFVTQILSLPQVSQQRRHNVKSDMCNPAAYFGACNCPLDLLDAEPLFIPCRSFGHVP